jgi:hypothetical protein
MITHDISVYRDAHAKQWRRNRRERIATAAMQALVTNPTIRRWEREIAALAIEYADALIDELDKEPQP